MTTPKHVADRAAASLYKWPDLNEALYVTNLQGEFICEAKRDEHGCICQLDGSPIPLSAGIFHLSNTKPLEPEQSDNNALSGYIKASIGRLPQMRTEAGRKRVDAIRDYLTDQLFDLGK